MPNFRLRTWLLAVALVSLLLAAYLLILPAAASADVLVTLAPTQPQAEPSTPDAYLFHAQATSRATISDPTIMLPGHGAPCDQPDEPGYPYGSDPDTQFLVTTSGVMQTGRLVTFPGDYLVTPSAPLDLRLDVITPGIAACFYAGATATSADPLVGVAQGAELDVNQSTDFATSGSTTMDAAGRVTLSWLVTSRDPHQAVQWRLGLPAGFSIVSSTLGVGKLRSVASVSMQWTQTRTLDDVERVVIDTPCSAQQATVHARLRVWRDDSLVIGTGNTGPPIKLLPCAAKRAKRAKR